MIRVNADIYRIAAAFISSEETRYFLQGVFIEPSDAGGATLTATDGHRLFTAHDPQAVIDRDAPGVILRLTDTAAKSCKAKRNESNGRVIEIDPTPMPGIARIIVPDHDGVPAETVATSEHCLIDGTFPDWRFVLPKQQPVSGVGSFEPKYLASFAAAGDELAKLGFVGATSMQILSEDASTAAWIRWLHIDWAYGVLMPKRAFDDTTIEHPTWLQRPKARIL